MKKLILTIVMLPTTLLMLGRCYFFIRRLRRQLPRGASRYDLGYASAPFMCKEIGYHTVLRNVRNRAERKQIDAFDCGLIQWMTENVPQEV